MLCSKCGKEISEDWKACPYCGNEINVNATDKAEKEDNPVQEEKAESHVHESEKKDDDVREVPVYKRKSFWKYFGLSIITFGIYSIYFWYKYIQDINKICKDDGKESPNYIVVMLLSLVTLGIYTGSIKAKMSEAKHTLGLAEQYMVEIGKEFEQLRKRKMSDREVREYIEMLLPVDEGSSQKQIQNVRRLQEDMKMRYYDAPDLKDVGNNAYRFINAVSDFATHAEPLRKTKNYRENMFSRTIDGNPLIDRAYQMVCA